MLDEPRFKLLAEAMMYLVMEAMTQAGIEAGLLPQFARLIVVQTVMGSAKLAEHYPDKSFEELRKQVSSPGGTTEAALAVLLHDDCFENLIKRAFKAAEKRFAEFGRIE